MMRTLLLAGLALGALTTATSAAPVAPSRPLEQGIGAAAPAGATIPFVTVAGGHSHGGHGARGSGRAAPTGNPSGGNSGGSSGGSGPNRSLKMAPA